MRLNLGVRHSLFGLLILLPVIVVIQGYYLWVVSSIHRKHSHGSSEEYLLFGGKRIDVAGEAKDTRADFRNDDPMLNEVYRSKRHARQKCNITLDEKSMPYYGRLSRLKRSTQLINKRHPQPFDIFTTTNGEFVDMADNWLEGLRRLGLRYNITLVCEDDEAYDYFKHRSNSEFRVLNTNNYSMSGVLRNASNFQDLILKRIVYLSELVKAGRDVLLADVDAVWLRDPLTHIMDVYDEYDIWIARGKTAEVPCPCFMYLKSNPVVKELTRSWIERIHYDKTRTKKERHGKHVTDQWALQPLLEEGEKNGTLSVKRLEKVYFPTGNLFMDEVWHGNYSHGVAIAHANHQGRHSGKLAFLKKFGLWFLNN